MNRCMLIPSNKMEWPRERINIFECHPSLTGQNRVPKIFSDEATLTATHLSNHIPSRVIQNQSPIGKLVVSNPHVRFDHSLPLRTFGCTAMFIFTSLSVPNWTLVQSSVCMLVIPIPRRDHIAIIILKPQNICL